MALPPKLQEFRLHLQRFIPEVDYYQACSFVNGYFNASDSQGLRGFREWILLRRGSLCAYWWPLLVVDSRFGEIPSGFAGDTEKHLEAIDELMRLLEMFLNERNADGGADRIMASYETKFDHV